MNHPQDEWKSKEEIDLDLELENRALELDLKLRGGGECIIEDDIDAETYNSFLKNVHAYEELDKEPKRALKSLFPKNFTFPDVTSFKSRELHTKLLDIYDILNQNNVEVSLNEKLPDKLVYQYLVSQVIPFEVTFPMQFDGFTHVIDGCDGFCPDCFQKKYCKTGQEVDWDESP